MVRTLDSESRSPTSSLEEISSSESHDVMVSTLDSESRSPTSSLEESSSSESHSVMVSTLDSESKNPSSSLILYICQRFFQKLILYLMYMSLIIVTICGYMFECIELKMQNNIFNEFFDMLIQSVFKMLNFKMLSPLLTPPCPLVALTDACTIKIDQGCR
uniref:Uncharacterized protein n=1 Tax=Strigamia maritima TaxID=126957 RepID=T1IY98_STRMM